MPKKLQYQVCLTQVARAVLDTERTPPIQQSGIPDTAIGGYGDTAIGNPRFNTFSREQTNSLTSSCKSLEDSDFESEAFEQQPDESSLVEDSKAQTLNINPEISSVKNFKSSLGKITDRTTHANAHTAGSEKVCEPPAAPLEAEIAAALRFEPFADASMFRALQNGNANVSYAAFQTLWAFMVSPSHRASDRARWSRAITRIPYWLELPEAFVLEVVSLARGAKGVHASSWGACERWREDTANAINAHPHLGPLLVREKAVSTKISEPGTYRTNNGNTVTVTEIDLEAVFLEGRDEPILRSRTEGWTRA